MLPTTFDVSDEDGILALLNLQTYRAQVAWELLDPDLIDHFTAELEAGHGIIWQASTLGGGDYRIDVVSAPSAAQSLRELTGTVEVTDGRLYVVDYTDLTMAAEDDGPWRLPTKSGATWFVEVPDGTYGVTVRQLFDPEEETEARDGASFEIVLAADEHVPNSPADALFWRTPAAPVAPRPEPEDEVSSELAAFIERVRAVEVSSLDPAVADIDRLRAAIGKPLEDEAFVTAVAVVGAPTEWASFLRRGTVVGDTIRTSGGRFDVKAGVLAECSVRPSPSAHSPEQGVCARPEALFPGGMLTREAFRAAYPTFGEGRYAGDDAVHLDGADVSVMYDDDRISLVTLRPGRSPEDAEAAKRALYERMAAARRRS